LDYKELGGTGVMIPEIGLGTWKYRGGSKPLQRGIELGATFIDTAEMYRTEDQVGEAIRGIRDHIFLATKVSGSHLRHDDILRAADNSLRLMGEDVIDLYQIHWPNQSVPILETMGALEELVDRGTVKYIGVSNFSVAQLKEAQNAMSKYPVVSNQVLYNLKSRRIELDLIPYCQENKITVIAYTPLADGSLAGKSRLLPDKRGAVMEEVAQESGKTPAQVALNWCLTRPPVVVIPKTNSVERTEDNCGATGWRLTADQLHRLDEAFPL
jgi:diketogulonate reductase-like aldo/keto reductase